MRDADGRAIAIVRRVRVGVVAVACVCALLACRPACVPGGFASADAAAYALVSAVRGDDVAKLRELLGDTAERALPLGSGANDRTRRREIAAASAQRTLLDYETSERVVLRVGDAGWTFPVPIVERDGVWRFTHDERALDGSRRGPS